MSQQVGTGKYDGGCRQSISDSLCKQVRVVRDETGLITDYQTEGEFPHFGNNDNRVDPTCCMDCQRLS
jgi:pyruvate-formate lyase